MLRSLFAVSATALLLTACGGNPDSKVEKGCLSMAKSNDDFTKAERKSFCSCMSGGVESADKKDKLTMAKLMKSYRNDTDFKEALDKAIADEKLSRKGATQFFGAIKTCSMNAAL
ncbi:hypothetical protein [Parvularcula sp. LCG005]|uniref:hypothetical protein n=1 Tax=Parvularcula sp. LCG005 TaxID=3078805 RepID=UPI0029429B48|nr:hypothetical protein [Parvularcula sp. LCG005]WOI53538.1 hypothetical protein RUI03_00755 [Parvularcula sp. LCG005]